MLRYFLLFILFFVSISVNAQETNDVEYPVDTPQKVKKKFFREGHDPAKAALFSAALPGAGQIYNKKYWKLPIVYVGLGGLAGLVGYSAVEWKGYTNAYRLEVNSDSLTTGTYTYRGFSGENQLLIKRRQFKRTLDLSAIALTVYYLLNIVDATVDAHLMDFNVTDDISVSIAPDFNYQAQSNFNFNNSFYTGVKVRFYLK